MTVEMNKAYEEYFKQHKRFSVLYGGAGSGKSDEIAQKKIIKVLNNKFAREMVLRKNYVSHKKSTYELFIKVIQRMDLLHEFDFRVSPLGIKCKRNGNEILFLGLLYEEDREKIKSIVDPTGAWFEEANEFDRDDINAVNLRIRGKNDTPKEIDISFNPIDEEHWLKDFIDNNPYPDDLFVLNTTYKDNLRFLDEEYTKMLEGLINEDPNLYNIYARGMWGSVDTRGRIYKSYDDEKNRSQHKYNPGLPVIVCCDFNVDPMKWALIQNVNGTDYIFDEIVQTDTTTERMVKELISRYSGKFIFYGDYSGTFKHTNSPSTDYDIIKQYLPGVAIYVKPNPHVIDRFNAVNWRLCNKEGIRRLYVNENCSHTRADFKKVKYKEGTREEDKSLEKYDGKNPIESLVHISSAVGYYIEYAYGLKGKSTTDFRRF